MAMAAITAGQEKNKIVPGSILINITYFGYKFIEFKLQDVSLLKTSDGKVIPIDRKKNISIRTDCSDDFKKIYWTERLYDYEMEGRLKTTLSNYDMEKLDNLRSRFIKDNANLDRERYLLTGPGKEHKRILFNAKNYFIPNRQFSYAIYLRREFASQGALIDLNSKEISFPFGLDELEHVVWNKEGSYIAYSAPEKGFPSRRILVIKDISKGKTLLRKSVGKFVSDISWSPDSSSVALLTYIAKISKSPGELLAATAGHPYFIKTFYLEIYDLSGNRIYNEPIKGSFKSSKGRIVWIDPADRQF